MKYEKPLAAFTGCLLALTIAAGSIGCLQSAFELTLLHPTALCASVAGITVLYALALQWRGGPLAFACLLALTAGYLLQEGTAEEQFWQLVYRISTIYDRAYHWGVFRLVDTAWDAGAADLPLGIWGALTALVTLWSVYRQKQVWLPVLTALLPPTACVVVTDTVPWEGYLLLLLAGLILLILTDSVRRESLLQGVRLTVASALPVILLLMGLFLAIPQKSYVNHSAVLRDNILTALEYLPQLMEEGLDTAAAGIRSKPARQVDLSLLGERIPFTYPVMEVTAEKGGTLYLRGQDYDQYDGLGWTASESREEIFSRQEAPQQTIQIQTRTGKQIYYLPYYPGEETILTGGAAENLQRETEYTVSCSALPASWRQTAYLSADAVGEADLQAYLALPETTRPGAETILTGLWDNSAGNTEKADMIAALVMDSAVYDLRPEKMPAGALDFTLWFLQSSDSGYCIHFATAATVLLRAAKVPARYVTGYMVEAIPGQTVTVTEENAHAWAEYYEPRLGCWIPLEATPAGEAEAPVSSTHPPETQPEETDISTEPEVPETLPQDAPPAAGNTPESPVPAAKNSLRKWLLLLLIPVFLLVLAAQRSARLALRRKRQRQGGINQQALQRWREAERLARLLKETPAEELIDLAQKAKYSQHELTAEELLMFDSYCRSCLRRLKEKSLPKRLVYQYFYAAF